MPARSVSAGLPSLLGAREEGCHPWVAGLGWLSRGLPFGPCGPDTPYGALQVTHDEGALGRLDLRHSILRPVPSSVPHSSFELLSSFLQTSIFFSSVECQIGPPSRPCHPEGLLWPWQLADDL